MFINNFDPVAIEIFSLEIRWYSLAYISGILLGWYLVKKIFINYNIKNKFDDYITYVIIGLILGMSLMGLASYLGASNAGVPIGSLWDGTSVLIVFGGSLAATAIAFKMSQVVHIFKLLKMIFQDDNFTLGEVVDDLCNLSTAYRKSRKDLESALENPPEGMPFRMHAVRDGCELILGGTKIDDIESFLENLCSHLTLCKSTLIQDKVNQSVHHQS